MTDHLTDALALAERLANSCRVSHQLTVPGDRRRHVSAPGSEHPDLTELNVPPRQLLLYVVR